MSLDISPEEMAHRVTRYVEARKKALDDGDENLAALLKIEFNSDYNLTRFATRKTAR